MDVISKFLSLFHLPTFGDVTASASKAAGQAATKAVIAKASQVTIPGVSSLHAPSLSSGTLFGVLVIIGVLLMALTLGRTRTLISAVSLYVAFSLQTIFPFYTWLLVHQSFTNDLPTLRVFVFLGLYAIVFGLMNRSILKARFNLGEASFLAVILMGLAQLGLLISIILNVAPSFYDISTRFPSAMLPYIGTQQSLFYWALVPILLLIFQRQSD